MSLQIPLNTMLSEFISQEVLSWTIFEFFIGNSLPFPLQLQLQW